MKQHANSSIPEHHELAKRIANGHENSEQWRELKELQRNLADRIRKIQHGQSGQLGNTG